MNYKAIHSRLSADTAITAIVSTRIYHDSAPLGATAPFIVFFNVTDNHKGGVNYATERWQFSLVGGLTPTNQSSTLNTLKEAVIKCFDQFRGTMGTTPNTQIIKGTQYGGAYEQPLPDNGQKQINLDFLFRYLRV